MVKKPTEKLKKQSLPEESTKSKVRRLRAPRYRSFSLQKRLKRQTTKEMPGAIQLFVSSIAIMRRHWKLFLGIALIYGFFNLVLVTGFSVVDLNTAKKTVGEALNGQAGSQVASFFTLFVYLLGSTNQAPSATAGIYRLVLSFIISLALIWALRQAFSATKNRVRIRDAFYQGMYPLIPFALVTAVLGLQLLPLVGGILLYGTVMQNGIAVTFVEQAGWTVFLGLLGLLSLYMIASSLFALFIVSLPNIGPMAALRSARELVLHRRWMIMRRLLFLPVPVLICMAIILAPFLIFFVSAAPWVFLVLSVFLLPVVASYLYTMYRALL
jgi:hypothetical protein